MPWLVKAELEINGKLYSTLEKHPAFDLMLL